jgi:hypothetical protein
VACGCGKWVWVAVCVCVCVIGSVWVWVVVRYPGSKYVKGTAINLRILCVLVCAPVWCLQGPSRQQASLAASVKAGSVIRLYLTNSVLVCAHVWCLQGPSRYQASLAA